MTESMRAGIGYILLCHLLGTALACSIRVLLDDGYHSFQLVFFYFAGPLLLLIPFLVRKRNLLRTSQWRYYALRSIGELGGFGAAFIGLSMMALPMHTALTFTVPLFGIVLAIVILREKASWHTAAALFCGMIGVTLITQPFESGLQPGVVWVLVASFIFGVCGVLIKLLTRTDSPFVIMSFTYIGTAILTLPLAISEWQTITLESLPLIGLVVLCSLGQQYFVSKAYQKAPMTLIAPMQFCQLIFVSVASYFLFKEVITTPTIIGSIIILTGTVYHVYHASRPMRIMSVTP